MSTIPTDDELDPIEYATLEASTGRELADINPKVTAATLGAAVALIACWVLEATLGIDIPAAVELAAGIVGTFAAGYLHRE